MGERTARNGKERVGDVRTPSIRLCVSCCLRWLLQRRRRPGAMLPLLVILASGGALPRGETGIDPAVLNPLYTMLPPATRCQKRVCSPSAAVDGEQACEEPPTRSSKTPQASRSGPVPFSSLRLAGGGSGLEWIERRLNSVFSSASKTSGSPSDGESAASKPGDARYSDRTPDSRKPETWERFDRAFDSIQTENSLHRNPLPSLSPMSSPEGPQQPSREREGPSSSRAAPATKNNWLTRRFSDAFASDAASPADVSYWSQLGWSAKDKGRGSRLQDGTANGGESHHASMGSGSNSRVAHESQQTRRFSGQGDGTNGQRVQSTMQQVSDLSEEESGCGAAMRSADAWRGERASSLDDSFVLKMHKKLKPHNPASDSVGHSSMDVVGLPTPLRAEWGPALNAARRTVLDAGWELPSISLAVQDVVAAVVSVSVSCSLPVDAILACRECCMRGKYMRAHTRRIASPRFCSALLPDRSKVQHQERRLRRALDVFPSSADLNCVYGDLHYFLRQDVQTALVHYKRALESDPEHLPAACGLATAMLILDLERTSACQSQSDVSNETDATGKIRVAGTSAAKS